MIICLIQNVQQVWSQKQLTEILLLDIKNIFLYVNSETLLQKMNKMSIDEDLLCWTQSFMSEWTVRLMLDDFLCSEQQTNSKLSQNSSISLIFFVIYINEVFESIEKKISEAHTLFFVNDIEIVISRSSVKQVCDRLQKAVKTVKKWDWAHVTQFDIVKTEAMFFIQKQDHRRRELMQKAHIQIEDHRMSFN